MARYSRTFALDHVQGRLWVGRRKAADYRRRRRQALAYAKVAWHLILSARATRTR